MNINPKQIEKYLDWKRTKEYFPPQWTPQDWLEELLMSEARDKLNILSDMLEQGLTDIDQIKEFLATPLDMEDENE